MKSNTHIPWYFALILILIISCDAPKNHDTTKEARAAIETSNEKWMAAFEKGDAAGIAELYTENAQFLPTNKAIINGRKSIQNDFQSMIDAGIKVKLEILEVEAQGNLAYEVGRALVFGPDGQQLDDSKYIVVWKKINDTWKMHKDIYNSSNPLPKPE